MLRKLKGRSLPPRPIEYLSQNGHLGRKPSPPAPLERGSGGRYGVVIDHSGAHGSADPQIREHRDREPGRGLLGIEA